MSFLTIQDLKVGYGDSLVLDGINLQVQEGEMIALLGPSGCGKTTLLNALCGFLDVSGGSINVAGRELTHLPPEQREMAMVFQSYALWPHMTVSQNIGYGLKLRKMSKADITRRVQEVLELVNLTGYENRPVTALSGGQRQRVALGRALAIQPPMLLLDEPLSNLDARIRLSVRHEIKSLQKQLGFTSIMVTHDREEAMVMADRIVVLNQGRIEQSGTPQEIYQQPATAFVADFMGADNQIQLPISVDNQRMTSTQSGLQLSVPALSFDQARLSNQPDSEQARLFFRSEAAQLFFHSEAAQLQPDSSSAQAVSSSVHVASDFSSGLQMTGIVGQCAYLGNSYRHSVRCGDHEIQVDHPQPLDEACAVTVRVPEQALHIF